mgnify:FL=1
MPSRPHFGLYGGAFDPPHLGHVAMAQAFIAQCALDRLFIVPTGQAWHKPSRLSTPAHRLAMSELAFADLDRATVTDIELALDGPSYTIDTLTRLGLQYPDVRWSLLIGQDQWAAFQTWHRWSDIANRVTIVVADRVHATSGRAGFDLEITPATASGLPVPTPLQWQPVVASSTDIRRLFAQSATHSPLLGPDTSRLLAPPVASYISQHQLYNNRSV